MSTNFYYWRPICYIDKKFTISDHFVRFPICRVVIDKCVGLLHPLSGGGILYYSSIEFGYRYTYISIFSRSEVLNYSISFFFCYLIRIYSLICIQIFQNHSMLFK